MSTTNTHDLAVKIAPKVQDAINAARPEILARADMLERVAIRGAWGVGMREIPVLVEAGLKELAVELATWSVADVLRWISTVAGTENAESR